jgi:hypothetical protein
MRVETKHFDLDVCMYIYMYAHHWGASIYICVYICKCIYICNYIYGLNRWGYILGKNVLIKWDEPPSIIYIYKYQDVVGYLSNNR